MNRIFASVFAYIWANGGCRETVLHLFFFAPKSEIPLFPLTFIIRNKQDIRQEYSS